MNYHAVKICLVNNVFMLSVTVNSMKQWMVFSSQGCYGIEYCLVHTCERSLSAYSGITVWIKLYYLKIASYSPRRSLS